ncbi:MAG TPA: four helix bundle protein [Chthoniobacterales bacterium]
MKKRTRQDSPRVVEEADVEFGSRGGTSNVQRDAGANAQRFELKERLLEYAVRIIRVADALPASKGARQVSDQLLRCGTSPLANHGELQGAESRKDFIHKLGVCLKEIREARRSPRLIHRVPLLAAAKVERLRKETEALIKIFSASIRTAEKNRR